MATNIIKKHSVTFYFLSTIWCTYSKYCAI